MEIVIKRLDLSYYILLLAILALPVNIDFIASFRITDFFLILVMIILSKEILEQSRIYFIIIYVLILSTLISILNFGIIRIETIIFLYKTSLPFFIFKMLKSLNKVQLLTINNSLFFISFLLAIWALAYPILLVAGIIQGNFRPSFPFSDFSVSDSHIYSNFLTISLFAFIEIWSRKFKKFNKIIIIVVFLLAILACGSRNGIVILGLYFLLNIKNWRRRTTNKVIFFSLILLFSFVALNFILKNQFLFETFSKVAERAIDIDLADESSSNRIKKLIIALGDWKQNNYTLGAGLFSTSLIWYDGLIGHLIAYYGIFAFIILSIIAIYIFNVSRINYKAALFLIVYLISNLITEFYLITRSIFPFIVIYYTVLKENHNLEYESSYNNPPISKSN